MADIPDLPELLTVEQLAVYLETTAQAIYHSRRRDQFPGNLGFRRGKRLLWRSVDIERGLAVLAGGAPDDPNTTNDATTAILWALQGIHKTLRAIHNELRAQRPQFVELDFEDVTEYTVSTTWTGDEEE